MAWSGLVLATASVLSLLSLVAEPATVLIPFSRYVGFAWFAAVSLMMWRRETSTDLPATGDHAVSDTTVVQRDGVGEPS